MMLYVKVQISLIKGINSINRVLDFKKKGLAGVGLFFCQNPLCRCATSPPEGEKNHLHIWIFSPHRGEWPKAEGVTTASTHHRVECPKSLPRFSGGKGVLMIYEE